MCMKADEKTVLKQCEYDKPKIENSLKIGIKQE